MARAPVGPVELEYEVIGSGRPILMIMGLGAQMIFWDDPFCQLLVERGFQVIRYDNRDVGLSTRLDHLKVPPILPTLARGFLRLPVAPPYTLSDMARDAVGLLDHLGVDRADVVGASMGGMIAQTLAIEHSRRVRTLTSIMSTPGSRWFLPRPGALRAILQPKPLTAEQCADTIVRTWRGIAGDYPLDEQRLRALGRRAFERGLSGRGFLRHIAAIATQRDRTEALRQLDVPTLVVHGRSDPLIPVAAGRATARAVPGALLLELPRMGHDLPPQVWPRVVDAIAALASHADVPRRSVA